MPLVVKTITGTLKTPAGVVLDNRQVKFEATAIFGDDGIVVLPKPVNAVTNDSGVFSANLYTVDTANAFIRYDVEIDQVHTATIDLADDSPTTLDDLINQGSLGNANLTASLTALQNMIDTRLAAHDPDRPPTTPHAMDDDFIAGALDAKWTKLSNDVTIAAAKSIATITPINVATKLVGATQPLGSLVGQNWCWVGKVNHNWANAAGDATTSDLRCGLVLKYAEIGDKYLGILFRDSIQIDVNRYDAAFSEEAVIASVGLADANLRTFWPSFAYIKVVRVGNGMIDIFASCDGVRWVTVANDLIISGEPSHVGFCAFATDLTNAPRGYVDWCRMSTSGDIGIIGG